MKLRSIQVLRGIAAMAVVLLHATAPYFGDGPGTFYWGAAGVDLFFVISGFIIGTIAPGRAAAEFFVRRAWRIFPMWWIATLPWLIAFPPTSLADYAVNATLWPIWGGFILPLPSIGWTLSFEMLFYCGATLALITRGWVPLTVFIAALVLVPLTDNSTIGFIGNPIILEFLFGVGLSRVPAMPRFAPAMLLLGIIGIALAPSDLFDRATAINADVSLLRVVCWGIPCALILHGAVSIEGRFTGRHWDFPVLLGNASFSIYLFHVLATLLIPGHWIAKFIAGVAIGVVAWWAIEKRLMSLPKQSLLRPRQPVQA